ncbi:MAG: hypothetical protein H6Q10_279 [Acidobacteria bacterium]|nr:hypothetical protein [Acidobacteriota bacterium]
MKCPKCGYLGFEPSDRCRNCGYEFSLAPPPPTPPGDLSLRSGEAGAPLADFDLGEARRPPRPTPPGQRPAPDAALEPGVGDRLAADLPLFRGETPGDGPPLVFSGAPTPPLAVRRSTPAVRRERPRPTPRPVQAEQLRFGAGEGEDEAPAAPALVAAAGARADAPIAARLSAGLLDWLMLAAIDLVVLYFTLRICQLPAAEAGRLPLAPLALFFVLLNGGYLSLLTGAGGQTIGKMAFGLKVVGGGGEAVPMGHAVVRTAALLLSAVPAGLGLVSILLDGGRRGLHDRLSGTRVVSLP